MERGYKALLDRLVRAAVAGNAWNADHIVPVFRGGGACGLENLRTLCTPCHADVTKQQAKERAAERWDGRPGRFLGSAMLHSTQLLLPAAICTSWEMQGARLLPEHTGVGASAGRCGSRTRWMHSSRSQPGRRAPR